VSTASPTATGQTDRAAMRVLWAPWRMAYIGAPKSPGCIFCAAAESSDRRASLVLAQRPAIVMLNRYPYANGHLMVAPRTHTGDFTALPAADAQVLTHTLQQAASRLAQAFQPEGMNLGMNLGRAGGAGIADHLHWHIVPRWVGDTNFMPLLAELRVMPEHLEAVYDRLEPLFADMNGDG
jgi:ATP adenylyltransferase